jgi:hypothetical protein
VVIICILELEEDGDKVLAKNELLCPKFATRSVTGKSEASEVTLCIRWQTPALRDPDKSTIYLSLQGLTNTVNVMERAATT